MRVAMMLALAIAAAPGKCSPNKPFLAQSDKCGPLALELVPTRRYGQKIVSKSPLQTVT